MKKNMYILLSAFLVFGCYITTQAQIINTVAGNGTSGSSGDGTAAISANLNGPSVVVFDAAGNMYIDDRTNNKIRKVDKASGIITTIAGTGVPGFGGDGGPATAAKFNDPTGLAIDVAGNLYVCDYNNSRIRKISTGGIITTIAGTGTSGYSGDGASATLAMIGGPWGIIIDGPGNIYICEQANRRIRKINTSGIISTIAGTGISGAGGDGGPATAATVMDPAHLVMDGAGNIYFADYGACRVRKINSSGIISTIAGNGTPGYSGDGGPATAAKLNQPIGIDIDPSGNVYFSDKANNRIRMVTASTGVITNIAGDGTAAYLGDGGLAPVAEIYSPFGVKFDCGGNLYIADRSNNRIRVIAYDHAPTFTGGHSQSVTICPDSVLSINSFLGASDVDLAQSEKWTVVSAPLNGTVVAAYTTTSTGGTLTPAGLTYTPNPGFSGNDAFKIQVTDCGNLFDTTTIHLTMGGICNVGVQNIANTDNAQMSIYPNPNNGSFTVNLISNTNETVHYAITNIVGEKIKELSGSANSPTSIRVDATAGIYFIEATTSHGKWNAKMLITK